MLRDKLVFLGCLHEDTLRRLSMHDDLAEAWAEASAPEDLAWLAARVANEPQDRIRVAVALLRVAELGAAEAGERTRGALGVALGLAEDLLPVVNDAGDRAPDPTAVTRALDLQLQQLVGVARAETTAGERKGRGKAVSTAPLAERLVFLSLEGARLALAGGWRGKAADHARLALLEARALQRPVPELLELLRREVPFPEFRTAWWTARAPEAPRTGASDPV